VQIDKERKRKEERKGMHHSYILETRRGKGKKESANDQPLPTSHLAKSISGRRGGRYQRQRARKRKRKNRIAWLTLFPGGAKEKIKGESE